MAAPAPLSSVTIGDARLTYLPDGAARFSPTAMFQGTDVERWRLHRRWLDGTGRLVVSIGAVWIQHGGSNVLVDLGVGPCDEEFPGFGPYSGGQLIDSMRQAGLRLEDVDTVIYTHLHMDHVGWTTRADAGHRTLTFPRARHLVAEAEWRFWQDNPHPIGPDAEAVRQPLRERICLLGGRETVSPGIDVVATPGHTPGLMSVVVSSGQARAIVLGDVVHCPAQFDEATWNCVLDVDPALAQRTRERLLAELEDPATVGAGGHLGDFTFGRLMVGRGRRLWSSAATATAGSRR